MPGQFTWVRGHATAAHIESGITTTGRLQGNAKADTNADQGVQLHGEKVYTLAKFYTKRHREYSIMMLNVAQHLVEGHMIHRALVQRAEAKLIKQASQAQLVQHTPLTYPNGSQCTPLTHIVHINRFPRIMQQYTGIQHVENFLVQLSITLAGSSIRGITWLELYTLYRLLGHPKMIANDADPAMAKPSLAQQLVHFKR